MGHFDDFSHYVMHHGITHHADLAANHPEKHQRILGWEADIFKNFFDAEPPEHFARKVELNAERMRVTRETPTPDPAEPIRGIREKRTPWLFAIS